MLLWRMVFGGVMPGQFKACKLHDDLDTGREQNTMFEFPLLRHVGLIITQIPVPRWPWKPNGGIGFAPK